MRRVKGGYGATTAATAVRAARTGSSGGKGEPVASYNDQQLFGAIQRNLQPGENVVSVAYGSLMTPMWARLLCVPFMLAGLIPGLILMLIVDAIMKKSFIVTLTDRRFIVSEVSGLHPKSTWDYPLPVQGRVTAGPKGAGFRIDISAARPFGADFLRNSGPTNFQNAANIGQALIAAAQMGQPQMGQGMGQPQMGQGMGQPGQLPPQGGWNQQQQGGAPQGQGGYGAPPQQGDPHQQQGGYGPPQQQQGGYGAPPHGAPQQQGGYGPPQGGGYGPPPGGQGGQGGQGGWGQS